MEADERKKDKGLKYSDRVFVEKRPRTGGCKEYTVIIATDTSFNVTHDAYCFHREHERTTEDLISEDQVRCL